jgi:transposase-like protein
VSAGYKADADIIVDLTRQGLSARRIAQRLGVHEATVRRWRVRTGISKAPAGCTRRYTPEELAIFARCIADGWSFTEISRTYGINRDCLARHFPGKAWTRPQIAEYAVMVRRRGRGNDHDPFNQWREPTRQTARTATRGRQAATKKGTVTQSPTPAPRNA